jgi:hypothetical protein
MNFAGNYREIAVGQPDEWLSHCEKVSVRLTKQTFGGAVGEK